MANPLSLPMSRCRTLTSNAKGALYLLLNPWNACYLSRSSDRCVFLYIVSCLITFSHYLVHLGTLFNHFSSNLLYVSYNRKCLTNKSIIVNIFFHVKLSFIPRNFHFIKHLMISLVYRWSVLSVISEIRTFQHTRQRLFLIYGYFNWFIVIKIVILLLKRIISSQTMVGVYRH